MLLYYRFLPMILILLGTIFQNQRPPPMERLQKITFLERQTYDAWSDLYSQGVLGLNGSKIERTPKVVVSITFHCHFGFFYRIHLLRFQSMSLKLGAGDRKVRVVDICIC